MANNVTGIGDINALVAATMDVEKLQLARLDKSKSMLDYQLSNYTNLSSLIKKFTDSLDHLGQIFDNNAWKISSSDNSVVSSVLTGKNTSPGNHQINISQLAQAHKVSSAVFTDKGTALSMAGSLDIQIGSDAFSLMIGTDDSLETIRDNINNSLNNPGISASILATTSNLGTPEYRLILTSKDTGLARQMTIGGTAAPALDLSHELSAAQDAQFTFDGFSVTRPDNTVSDLLDGITFTLNKAGQSAELSIAVDTENRSQTLKSALNDMVNAYNTLIDTIDKNQATRLTRDSTYSVIKMRLTNSLEQSLGSLSIQSLLDAGIKKAPSERKFSEDIDPNTQKNVEYTSNGKLTIDDKALSAAIDGNYDDLSAFFTDSTNGFIKTIDGVLTEITREGGNISSREKIIGRQEYALDNRITREESRLDALEEYLYTKFSELNNFVERYQRISEYMERQITALEYIYKK
ncbi:flagellar filament capping protein FliD [Legionella sp. CNM-4043-24]|uniref:flagellar filament capping protein FliD n=1 Tax=Legionella sp. CNM-4043-24 TaxID=3421646 RepID=UPI00403B3583